MVSNYQKGDIKSIIDLGNEVNEKFSDLFKIDDLPKQERIFVYKDHNEVLGFLHILVNIDVIEILNLIVKNEYRQRGIATFLLDYLLSDVNLNPERIILEVRESNTAAIKFYEKFNFAVINTREKYYGNENALVMERVAN